MKLVREKIVLQYPPAGTRVGHDGSRVVHPSSADRFVAIDRPSGGYPYPVDFEEAYDFRSVTEASAYIRDEGFIIRRVRVTHEVIE